MRNKKGLFMSATIYKILLEFSYIFFASPAFSYMGLIYEPRLLNIIASYLMFYILLLFIPKNQNKPSNQLIQLLFLTSMVPFLSIFWLANKSIQYTFYVFLCYLFLFVGLYSVKPIKIPLLKKETNLTPRITNIAFALSILILVLRTIKFGGVDVRSFNFGAIYELRSEIQYYGIWNYLINWLGKLLIPLCITMSMIEKRKFMFILSCGLQIFLYLSTGSKATLFSVVLIICTTYILKKGFWSRGVSILYSSLIGVSIIFYKFTSNIWLIALTVVRQLTFPAIISFKYYDFFSLNEKLHFSEGLLGNIFNIESPYNIRAAYIISGSVGNHENTGFLSDAYSNGGIIAMIIMSCIFLVILLYVDSISRNSDYRFKYTALMVFQIITLNDASLLTTTFTGGLAILLVIMYIIASEETDKLTQ